MENEVLSKFNENPKTKTAWWAMGLGLGTIFTIPMLGIFAAVIRPVIDEAASSENTGAAMGYVLMIFLLIIFVSALTTSIISLRKGERSWALWVGFVPVILMGSFGVFMIVGEFIFPH